MGSLSPVRPRRDPDPGAASTHVAQDRSLGAREAGPTQPVEGHTFPAIEIAEPTEVRPGPSAASTHIARDRSVAVREGRPPLRTGQKLSSRGQPAPEPEDDSLLFHDTAATHAARGRTTVSWDLLPRFAQDRTRTPVRLAHTSPRIGAWLFGTDGCRSVEDRTPWPRDCQPTSRRWTAARFAASLAPMPLVAGQPCHGIVVPNPPETGFLPLRG